MIKAAPGFGAAFVLKVIKVDKRLVRFCSFSFV
jgi:hypothetical protein